MWKSGCAAYQKEEIRADCAVLILDRHLLPDTSWRLGSPALERPDRSERACRRQIADLLLEGLDAGIALLLERWALGKENMEMGLILYPKVSNRAA